MEEEDGKEEEGEETTALVSEKKNHLPRVAIAMLVVSLLMYEPTLPQALNT